MAVAALVLGIVGVFALFDDSEWDTGTVVGLGMFAVTGLALGIAGMNKERTGTAWRLPALRWLPCCCWFNRSSCQLTREE